MYDNQSQTHWAYIAGVMDSDGCFMISKHKRKTRNKCTERALRFPKNVSAWSCTYMPCLKIVMIEPEAVHFIKNEMDYGNVYISGARKSRPNSKDIYQWYLRSCKEVIAFISSILPYLKVKKERALHVLSFANHMISVPTRGYKGLSLEELDYREDMYLKMREFNGNKVGATTEPHKRESVSDSLIL